MVVVVVVDVAVVDVMVVVVVRVMVTQPLPIELPVTKETQPPQPSTFIQKKKDFAKIYQHE